MTHALQRLRLATLLLVAACSSATSAVDHPTPTPSCTFTNPIGFGADPWVIREGSSYYFTESRDEGIYVYKTSDLTRLKTNGVKVWTAPDTGWNRVNIWAPELHHIDGRWYIYYAAGRSGPPYISQRAGVLQSTADDPQGTYADKGMLYTGNDVAADTGTVWAIDLTVDEINGQLYAVWSGWDHNAATDRTPQNLYIARMSDPATIATNRVRLTSPTEPWEIGTELNLEEGPEFLHHGDQTFIVYSARESWLKDYRLGQLRLVSPGASPLDSASFVKTGPVFVGAGDVFGVGHASFTTSPDGAESWIVYHSKVSADPGWDRVIREQTFTWNADGSPHFGTPVATGRAIPIPSGGPCP